MSPSVGEKMTKPPDGSHTYVHDAVLVRAEEEPVIEQSQLGIGCSDIRLQREAMIGLVPGASRVHGCTLGSHRDEVQHRVKDPKSMLMLV